MDDDLPQEVLRLHLKERAFATAEGVSASSIEADAEVITIIPVLAAASLSLRGRSRNLTSFEHNFLSAIDSILAAGLASSLCKVLILAARHLNPDVSLNSVATYKF